MILEKLGKNKRDSDCTKCGIKVLPKNYVLKCKKGLDNTINMKSK